MRDGNRRRDLLKRLLCIITVIFMCLSMVMMSACSKDKAAESDAGNQTEAAEEDENEVRAADPMTEEELEDYTGGGCVGESADSYY